MKQAIKISSRSFTYEPSNFTFRAEISELNNAVPRINLNHLIDGEHDIVIVSAKTGKERDFVFQGAIYNGEGEIQYWLYTCRFQDLCITIWND